MKLDENSIDDNHLQLINQNAYANADYIALQSNKYKKTVLNNFYQQRDPNSLTNEEISKQFGQNNYEKGLVLISVLFILNSIWLYFYESLLTKSFTIAYYINLVIQGTLTLSLSYLYMKIRQNKVINPISTNLLRVVDLLSIIYLITVVTTFVWVNFQAISIFSLGYLVFSIKFALEIYFIILILKIFSFSSCSYKIQETIMLAFSYFTTYVLCIDEDLQNNNIDYQEFDELDSEY